MAFTREVTATPVGIGRIEIQLVSDGGQQEANFAIFVKRSDGSIVTRSGSLTPHLTPAQISQLMTFMDVIRAKAVVEVLPV